MEAHIIKAGVIKAVLVLLHLGLDAADSSVETLLAPVAILSPVHARSLQRRVAAAAESDVVRGRVVTEETLMGLHAHLERGEHTAGAVHGVGPFTKAGQERIQRKSVGRKDPRCGLETLEGRQDISTSERLICNTGRSDAFISPLNMMGKVPDFSFLLLFKVPTLFILFNLYSKARLVPQRSRLSFTRSQIWLRQQNS